jgi:hypothetical protein
MVFAAVSAILTFEFEGVIAIRTQSIENPRPYKILEYHSDDPADRAPK